MKKFLTLVAATFLAALVCVPITVSSQDKKEAPGLGKIESYESKLKRKTEKVPNHYIVVLKDYAADPKGEHSLAGLIADDLASAYRGRVKHVYRNALHGFTVEMTEEDVLLLLQDSRVVCVVEART